MTMQDMPLAAEKPVQSSEWCWRRRLGACLCLACLWCATAVKAETFALIMTIGQYADPSSRLPGADVDARLAVDIAIRLGATQPQNRVVLSDQQLSFREMRAAVLGMRQRLRAGDTLFVYFSGHGRRQAQLGSLATAADSCRESLVTVEGSFYPDWMLVDDLEALSTIAGRVIFFNDSCHSGGTLTKRFSIDADGEFQIKAYPGIEQHPVAGAKVSPAAQAEPVARDAEAEAACARFSNSVSKSFRPFAQTPATKMLYLAAAADHEAAFSTPQGSQATQAWHACLHGAVKDLNGDGQISGSELAECAKGWLLKRYPDRPQQITPKLNVDLPLLPAFGQR